MNIRVIPRYTGKYRCRSALPNIKHNCVVSFLRQLYWLLFWGKVIFSVVCVKNSVQWGGLPHCMLGYSPPGRDTPSRHSPAAESPQRQTPPIGSRHPRSACWEIPARSGRYTSYWNAYLFIYAFKYIFS